MKSGAATAMPVARMPEQITRPSERYHMLIPLS
jgi:hypothetical protein